MQRFIFSCLLLTLTSVSVAHARDKIGLVLSGGGAKGTAHIGVLKVLEKNNIPIDYIAGTSIGSYVGGMYALGYSVDEIEKIMMALPWSDSYSDDIPRQSLSYANKQHRDRYNLAIRLGYSQGEFKVPHGLLLGQSAYQILQRSTGNINTFKSFDDLAIPYRAVASDIATAEMVVLDSGNLNSAMKASAAVPGIVSAVEINGQMLVDGGITNNMPISVIKEMGADVVIAVDIGSPLVGQNELTSTVAVLGQLSTILTNNTSLSQKKLLSDQDILLRPHIEQLSTTDWSVMPLALKLGEEAALAQEKALQKLSVSTADYQRYKQDKRSKSQQWFNQLSSNIVDIKFNNNSRVDNQILAFHFAVELNKPLSKEQLDAAINRVYALNKFEQVSVAFDNTVNGRILTLTTKAKSWGPNYFDFGFNLKTDFSNGSIISLDMSYLMTDVNQNGGRWLNEIKAGWETELATEFYQPLNREQDIYGRVRGALSLDRWQRTNVFPIRPEIRKNFYEALIATGYNFTFNGILELGAIAETGELSYEPGVTEKQGNYDYDSYGGFIKLGYDTLNSINFPTQGNKLTLEIQRRKDKYAPFLTADEIDESTQITLDWRGAFALRGHTFVGIASFATLLNETDFSVHITELGGFLNLSGYQEDALIGVHKAFAAVVYQYDLGRELPGGSGLPIYLGTSFESGNVWQIDETIKTSDLIHSGSIYLGTDTSFGPAVFGLGVTSDGISSLFLSIGKNW
jgi:NTE family protein